VDEWAETRAALRDAGVAGWPEFGRFVNDTRYFEPSAFDERAALPVLLELLPTLTDRAVVGAVAGHLGRPWARPVAFPGVLAAFRDWAARDPLAGWALGSALVTVIDKAHLPVLLELAEDRRYGMARQMVVDALWRLLTDPRVVPMLRRLIEEPGVALHAMGALRRSVGNAAALPDLRRVRDTHPDATVRRQATQQVRRAEKASGGEEAGGVVPADRA
jgi:hypothetical protein